MPLIAETLILVTAAYLLGIGIGWLLRRRKRRDGFL
jgi:LPXTG-motif cell wall-anchored protein